MHLLDVVDCQPKERILEVGVGTGATLVEMAATYPNSKLYGVEASPSMFAAATTRLKLCGLDNKVALQIVDPSSNLPFYGGGFDKIYIESVLAIQEGEHLRRLLEQVNRSLAPGGKLYVNESLWLETTSPKEIENINSKCRNRFGIIQCNDIYSTPNKLNRLMKELGFLVESKREVDGIDYNGSVQCNRRVLVLSMLFDLKGKLKTALSYKMRSERKKYLDNMTDIFENNKKYLEGVLFVASKPNI